MNVTKEMKKQEALKRLKVITEHFNLGNNLVKYFEEDRLYYSYAYSMDTINYDPKYAEAVRTFERNRNALVYHVIEAQTQDGYTLLSFLYVSDNEKDWMTEKLEGDEIFTYTLCVEEQDYSDMGWITLAAPMGYLMRIA